VVDLAAALRRTASGDTEAFGEVVSRFQDMAVGYAYSVLGNSDDAQDAAQEAFVTAYIRIGDLRDASRFARWFRRILLTACRTVRRRRAMAEPTEGLRPHVDDTHSPSCRLEQAQTQREVQEAINSLSLANRIAVVLFYIRGYTVDEVAGFLEVPAGTIKRRLHDARKQLRKEMVGMVQEDLQGRRPTAQFRRQVLERIAHWERFGGTDEEKLDMVASDPDWIQLMEVEVSLEPMSSECRQIRRQIASMEACDEHYPENLDALAGMIGTMTPGRILDCGDACEARRDEAARIRQALEAWREETMAPGGPAGAIGQEVTDLLGQRTDEKVQLVDHLIGKLGDNGYRVYEDEDEDFELTESRIQHLEICNYNWG